MNRVVERTLKLFRSRRTRLALNVVAAAGAVVVTVVAARHFMADGWPLAHADAQLAAVAGVLFLSGYAFKALGWRNLFAAEERPNAFALATATGAASVTGLALPGRFDDAVRIAVVRRHRGCRAGIGALALSLFTLGLVDTVALLPLASTAAGAADVPTWARLGLSIVAFAGVGAAGVILALPRLGGSKRLARFRITGWLGQHAPCTTEATKAVVYVLLSWVVRGVGLFFLLGALGVSTSFPLAIAFLCAGAASAALPIAPAGGAAVQAGAGAGLLVAAGVPASGAVAFAVAAQALTSLAGAAVVGSSLVWHAGARLVPQRVAV